MRQMTEAGQDSRLGIRAADMAEMELLLQWRMEVLHQVFAGASAAPWDALRAANERYYQEQLAAGTHIACFAEREGTILGCGGVCFQQEMPSPDNPSGQCAYLMNIYVRASYRGHGAGREIVTWLIRQARERGITKIYLETTAAGRRLYQGLGFADMADYMILKGGKPDA